MIAERPFPRPGIRLGIQARAGFKPPCTVVIPRDCPHTPHDHEDSRAS